MIKVIEVEKDGIVYERCKNCPDTIQAFRSKEKHISPQSKEAMYFRFCGLANAFSKGYKLKRFTIC